MSEQNLIESELNRFLKCNIIEKVDNIAQRDEFISNIFIRPKKDGKIRIILNLKQFNDSFMENIHFKMETLQQAINSMRKDCFFASVDLSEAFYSIPIRMKDRKYFRFIHNGQKYQFTALIMGLTTSPRVFTKVMKPVFSSLRGKGHISSAYIDDSCLQASTFAECQENVSETVKLMDSLGLTVHSLKSVLIPCKQITFLGFILCSETMSVRLTPERQEELISLCCLVLSKRFFTIRLLAKLIGKMVAAEPGVETAPLFYKPLEKVKDKCIKRAKGNFNNFMKLPETVKPTISWWIKNLRTSKKLVSHGQPKFVIYSDASKKGYGAINKTTNATTNGQWSLTEQNFHINILELKACQLALTSLCKDTTQCHIRIYMDNSTSCTYVNKFGGKTDELNNLAREIWMWCIDKNIFISAAHVAGTENNEADRL